MLNFSLSSKDQVDMATWLVADPTDAMLKVRSNESHKSRDQHYERRFCPRDDVCVAFSTIAE
jgi:hypothetical protein